MTPACTSTAPRRRPLTTLAPQFVGAFLILLFVCCPLTRASALDIQCVESSKYKYLMVLFNGDPVQFARYMDIDAAHLPPQDACRAALMKGGVEQGDSARLIDFIARNRGWLDTIYVNSGGGSVDAGLRTALVARDFWLKVKVQPKGASFWYRPDFMTWTESDAPADDLHRLRAAYQHAAEAVPTQTDGGTRCASACTFILASGVDRDGIAEVHRAGVSGDSIAAVSEGVARAEKLMMGLYDRMDVGERFMLIARATPGQTTSPIPISRYPSLVEDALTSRCKSDEAQLDDFDALLRYAAGDRDHGDQSVDTSVLEGALTKVAARRPALDQCVARYSEKQRLSSFQKYCGHGCSDSSLDAMLKQQFADLIKGGQ